MQRNLMYATIRSDENVPKSIERSAKAYENGLAGSAAGQRNRAMGGIVRDDEQEGFPGYEPADISEDGRAESGNSVIRPGK